MCDFRLVKETFLRLRSKKGTSCSDSPRASPPIPASTPRTPGGVDGMAARRARPRANEFRFFPGYKFVGETNFGGAPSASPPSKKFSSPIAVEGTRRKVPEVCAPKHFASAHSAASSGHNCLGPYQKPACIKATGVPQPQSKLRIVATHVSWFTRSPLRRSPFTYHGSHI